MSKNVGIVQSQKQMQTLQRLGAMEAKIFDKLHGEKVCSAILRFIDPDYCRLMSESELRQDLAKLISRNYEKIFRGEN